jgi:hypothetical protein
MHLRRKAVDKVPDQECSVIEYLSEMHEMTIPVPHPETIIEPFPLSFSILDPGLVSARSSEEYRGES